jgi:hypothetical protein
LWDACRAWATMSELKGSVTVTRRGSEKGGHSASMPACLCDQVASATVVVSRGCAMGKDGG